MKPVLTTYLPSLALAAVVAASGDHDHDEVFSMEPCSEFNVSDAATCEAWCMDAGNANAPLMEFEWIYKTEHGDFEEFHIDYLTAWECHCEEAATAVSRAADGDGDDEHTHKMCKMDYELPTCEAMGLGECETDADATMTCGELCDKVGLGRGGSTTGSRHLHHTSDLHFCAHHESDEEHGDHRNRRRSLEGDHEEHHGTTLCFCNAISETTSGATVSCSDAELTSHDHGHDDANILKGYGVLALSLIVSIGALLA